MPLAEALEYHVSTAIQLVARRVKMRALGAMGAAATLPGDRITDSTLPGGIKKGGVP